jgi:hypothetical protein
MTKKLSEEELKQICRRVAEQLSNSVRNDQSPDEEESDALRLLLNEIRRASGVDRKKIVQPHRSGREVDAYWYEIQQTLVGFQEEQVDFDYRGIIKEELLDKLHSVSP